MMVWSLARFCAAFSPVLNALLASCLRVLFSSLFSNWSSSVRAESMVLCSSFLLCSSVLSVPSPVLPLPVSFLPVEELPSASCCDEELPSASCRDEEPPAASFEASFLRLSMDVRNESVALATVSLTRLSWVIVAFAAQPSALTVCSALLDASAAASRRSAPWVCLPCSWLC